MTAPEDRGRHADELKELPRVSCPRGQERSALAAPPESPSAEQNRYQNGLPATAAFWIEVTFLKRLNGPHTNPVTTHYERRGLRAGSR
jgi:hypothetical protein